MKSVNPLKTPNFNRKSTSKIARREILLYESSKVVSPSHGSSPYASFRRSFKKGSVLISRCESTEDTRKSTATNASHLSHKKYERENKARISVHQQFASCIMTPKNCYAIQSENELIKSRNNFKFMYQIGFGGFGKVWKVQEKNSRDFYAMKEIQKRKVIDKDSVDCILNERKVLSSLSHPFLVNIQWAFQDQSNLYLILDYLKGADLRYHICYKEIFTEEETKFILACLILAVEEIHSKGIVHRDIKPENLVLEESGYIRLTDFGIAKYVKELNVEKFDSSGTPGYMAPEVLMRERYNEVSDFFAFGVMGYELMTGNRPYIGKNRKEIKEKIQAEQKFIDLKELPKNWSCESADFINKLLIKNPEQRLGSTQGVKALKEHPWMKRVNWKKLYKKEIIPPFTPHIVCETKEYLDEIQSYNEMNEEPDGKCCKPLSMEENLLFEGYSLHKVSHLSTPLLNVRNTFQKNELKVHSKSKKWLKMS